MKLTEIRLQYCEFMSPRMFHSVCEGIVSERDRVVIDNRVFKVEDIADELIIGKAFILKFRPYHVSLIYKDDLEMYEEFVKQQKRDLIESNEVERQLHLQRRQVESRQFWEHYKFDFQYSIEIKERLSGLTFNSSGNGMARNSVFHLYLKQPIQIPNSRIKRNVGFLCSQIQSKHGGDWSGTLGDGVWDVKEVQKIVTCKQCLKMMDKIVGAR